jgi:hypothetical protein
MLDVVPVFRSGGHCLLHPAGRPEAGAGGCPPHQGLAWHLGVRSQANIKLQLLPLRYFQCSPPGPRPPKRNIIMVHICIFQYIIGLNIHG